MKRAQKKKNGKSRDWGLGVGARGSRGVGRKPMEKLMFYGRFKVGTSIEMNQIKRN